MRPESELQAEEVAFVNTCEKHSLLLAVLARGRHQFELNVYDPATGKMLRHFGTHGRGEAVMPATTPDELIELADSDYDGPVVLQNKTLKLLTDQLVAARNRIDDDTETINRLRAPVASAGPPMTEEGMDALVRPDEPLVEPVEVEPDPIAQADAVLASRPPFGLDVVADALGLSETPHKPRKGK